MPVRHVSMPPAPAVDLATIYRWMRILVSLSAGLDSFQMWMVFARTVMNHVKNAMVQDTTSVLAATMIRNHTSHQKNVLTPVLMDPTGKDFPIFASLAMHHALLVLVKELANAMLALHPECCAKDSVSHVRWATSSPHPPASATNATLHVLSALDQILTSAQTVKESSNWTPGPQPVFPAANRALPKATPAVTVLVPKVSAPPLQDTVGQSFLQQC